MFFVVCCQYVFFFFSSRRRHTRCALVTGVQTCALPIYDPQGSTGEATAGDHGTRVVRRRTASAMGARQAALRRLPPVSETPEPLRLVDVQRAVTAELDRIAPVIDELGERFDKVGHELALVGGPVRDAMLGRRSNDLDFTTSARPEVTEKILRSWGDAWWDMGRDFGTIGCRKGDWVVE